MSRGQRSLLAAAVAAALVLALLPWLRASRSQAASPAETLRVEVPLASAGPVCRAAPDPAATQARLGRLRERIAERATSDEAEGIVILNSRGYNYAAPELPLDPKLLALEARTQR